MLCFSFHAGASSLTAPTPMALTFNDFAVAVKEYEADSGTEDDDENLVV
jgi:hypothetical protein